MGWCAPLLCRCSALLSFAVLLPAKLKQKARKRS
jgi:hypothetical protein